MTKKKAVQGTLALITLMSALTGCIPELSYPVVNALDLTGELTAPVKGGTVQKRFAEQPQYTGKLAWEKDDGSAFTGNVFEPSVVYIAKLTLTAKPGYNFAGVKQDGFYHKKGHARNAPGNDETPDITVAIEFPKTAGAADNLITALDLTGLIPAPVKNVSPVISYAATADYNGGTITWTPGGIFEPGTVYRAEITIAPKANKTISGLDDDSFTHAAASSVVLDVLNSTVLITFKATAAANQDTVVNAFDLTAFVTAPVRAASPNTAAFTNEQYGGTIEWKTETDAVQTGAFGSLKIYKAVVTLTPKSGYTLAGVSANTFIHTGAASVAHAANTGTVTIVFPRTAANKQYWSGSASLGVLACCWYAGSNRTNPSAGPAKLIDGNTSNGNYWDYAWGNNSGSNLNDTSWPADLGSIDEGTAGKGHAVKLDLLSLKRAHFLTIDLKAVKDNVISLRIMPRYDDTSGEKRFAYWELYISNSEIGVDPRGTGITKLGSGTWGEWTSRAWYEIDITQFTGGIPASGRYLQIRSIGDGKNGLNSEWLEASLSELQVGYNQD